MKLTSKIDSIPTVLSFREYMDQNHERTKARAKTAAKEYKKRKKKAGQYSNKNPLIKFLRQRTCRLNYGIKLVDIGVRPELNEDKLIDQYNKRRFGAALTNEQFQQHFDNLATYYFWACPLTGTDEILIMVDIDVHDGIGTTEGARRFADLIKETLFPGMYYEPSTNGQGIHGYIVVQKVGISVTRVRHALKNLDTYLKELAKSVDAAISCVEIKGTPPLIRYDEKGNIRDITFGQFGKYPRGEGVMDTCKVKYLDLACLDVADIPHAAEQEVQEEEKPLKLRLGSYDTRVVRQDVLDKLPDLERYAATLLQQWIGGFSFKAGRWTVTATDVAQFFAIKASIKPDPDDALPVRRIGKLWQAVYEAGDFSRPWNHHRFKAIRDLLSEHGHIDWVDPRYQNLPERRGRACRWRFGMALESRLLSLLQEEATSVDTHEPLPHGGFEFRMPRWYNFKAERERQRWEEDERRLEQVMAA